MRILIVFEGKIPVTLYGGTQRVIWGLGKELARMGHEVTYLVAAGSVVPFAGVQVIDERKEITQQISKGFDVVHFQTQYDATEEIGIPYIITRHGNPTENRSWDKNTVFVSKNHARRYGSDSYVHNGLDWTDYDKPNLDETRSYYHFLGNASWRVKNVAGAIEVIRRTKEERLHVLGGVRFNFLKGIRITLSHRASFAGMVGGKRKTDLLNQSKGLVFPVRWHEPFGLAIIESLYYGCPVFGTPYGSLPELVNEDVGYLSNSCDELAEAIDNSPSFDPKICHEYARDKFNSRVMAENYLKKYYQVIEGETLNRSAPRLQERQIEKFLPWHI